MRRILVRIAFTGLAAAALAACSGNLDFEPEEVTVTNEIEDGVPGLFSGEDGVFTITVVD